MFLGPLYMPSTSFHSKTPTVHSGQNSWPVETRSNFVQNLPDFFFLLILKNFPIVSWTAVYAIYKFLFKNTDIAFRSKFMTSRTLGHFHTKFIRVLFYFILLFISKEFSIYFLDHHICYLQVFVQKWWHCIPVKILDHWT